jgi:hypothetical protein
MSDDFNWDDLDPCEHVLGHQPRTCVYRNLRGEIIIRQQAGVLEEDDQWLIVQPENVAALISALLRIAPAAEQIAGPAPMSAAERKRKQRERERDQAGPHVTQGHAPDVTPRDYDPFLDRPVLQLAAE